MGELRPSNTTGGGGGKICMTSGRTSAKYWFEVHCPQELQPITTPHGVVAVAGGQGKDPNEKIYEKS